jgi:integrase
MRLPNGYGSVYKLSGNRRKPWVARKTTGWDFDTNKKTSRPIYKFIGYYKTKAEALNALAAYNRDPYSLSTDPTDISLEDLYDRWSLEKYDKTSESNINGLKAAWKVLDPIKDMKISDIKLDHLQITIDNSNKNTPTLRKVKSLLGMMYKYAVGHEILPKFKQDIISSIDVSSAGNPNTTPRTVFTYHEINSLKSTKNIKYLDTILILLYSGMRISELLDLKSENVYLKESYFDIVKAKTPAGIRKIPIAKKIYPIVEKYYKQDQKYLITMDNKHIYYQKYRDKCWNPVMNFLGLSHRPHDTRHTFVSLLTEKEVDPRTINQIIGHSGKNLAENTYTHIDIENMRKAINLI